MTNEQKSALMRNPRFLQLLGVTAFVLSPLFRLILRVRQPELERFLWISEQAKEAYRKGQWVEAEQLASEGLLLAERYPKTWNYGNVIHDCHQVLGLLQMREGKTQEAIECLLAAGRTPGSPQLNSFGPAMVLARELLLRGERTAVHQYLNLIIVFWKKDSVELPELRRQRQRLMKRFNTTFPGPEEQHQQLIKQWKTDIKAGRVPQHINWQREL